MLLTKPNLMYNSYEEKWRVIPSARQLKALMAAQLCG